MDLVVTPALVKLFFFPRLSITRPFSISFQCVYSYPGMDNASPATEVRKNHTSAGRSYLNSFTPWPLPVQSYFVLLPGYIPTFFYRALPLVHRHICSTTPLGQLLFNLALAGSWIFLSHNPPTQRLVHTLPLAEAESASTTATLAPSLTSREAMSGPTPFAPHTTTTLFASAWPCLASCFASASSACTHRRSRRTRRDPQFMRCCSSIYSSQPFHQQHQCP